MSVSDSYFNNGVLPGGPQRSFRDAVLGTKIVTQVVANSFISNAFQQGYNSVGVEKVLVGVQAGEIQRRIKTDDRVLGSFKKELSNLVNEQKSCNQSISEYNLDRARTQGRCNSLSVRAANLINHIGSYNTKSDNLESARKGFNKRILTITCNISCYKGDKVRVGKFARELTDVKKSIQSLSVELVSLNACKLKSEVDLIECNTSIEKLQLKLASKVFVPHELALKASRLGQSIESVREEIASIENNRSSLAQQLSDLGYGEG